MKAGQIWHRPWVAAVLSGGWALATWDLDVAPWAWAAMPLVVAGVWWSFRAPVCGALLVLVAGALICLGGGRYGEIEIFLPTMWVLYWLGRQRSSWHMGLAFSLSFALTTALRWDAPWYSIPTAIVTYSAPWVFGRVVWQRARAAKRASQESARLASTDLRRVFHDSAATTAELTTRAALGALHESVSRMCVLAQTHSGAFTAKRAEAIRIEGERAIGELHRILQILRSPQATPSSSPPNPAPVTSARSVLRPLVPILAVATAAGIGLIIINQAWGSTLWFTALSLPLSILFLHRSPLAAAALAAGGMVIAMFTPPVFPEPIGVWLVIIIWQFVRIDSPHATMGGVITFIAAIALGVQSGGKGVGFVVVATFLAVVSAWGWREHDAILHQEQERLASISAAIAAAQQRVERAERRRIAQELHDGTSHGITAMSLQTQAAIPHLLDDPARAEDFLRLARRAGEQALEEISEIWRQWQDEVDTKGWDAASLIDGIASLGMRVTYRQEGRPVTPPEMDVLRFRVLQESLTNALRHSPGSDIIIDDDQRDGWRHLRVWNSPPRLTPTLGSGAGTGLSGLHDRVRSRGGRFTAGPSDGGFEVRTSWPISPGPLPAYSFDVEVPTP